MKFISTNSGVQAGVVFHYYLDGTVYYRLAIYYYPEYMRDAPDGCRHGFEIHAVDAVTLDQTEVTLTETDVDDFIAHGECELVDYGDLRNARHMAREIRDGFARHTRQPDLKLPRKRRAK